MFSTLEDVLYFYILVSIALIFYNIRYILLKNKEKEKYNFLVSKYIKEYYESIKNTKEIKNINKNIVKELSNIKNLEAFNDAISSLKYTEELKMYKENMYNYFLELSRIYNKKSDMEKSLFVYIVGNLNICSKENVDLNNNILGFLENPSVYLVENILKTFIKLEEKDNIVRVIDILNLRKIYHSDKLISDGLLEYKGDKLELVRELWKYRNKWMVCYVKAIIKFIRIERYDFKEEFYYALTKEKLDREIRIELVRYFGIVKYDKVLDYLLE